MTSWRISFYLLTCGMLVLISGCTTVSVSTETDRPNILLIMTDDQGYGDLRFHGNPHIHTPTLDAFASKSVRFNRFFVSPVCAPTRASLMTGRHSLRTGVHDTYNGGAIMAGNEVTIAELLKTAGYETGIFGKWHLGDNYPSRPQDQGFTSTLNHLGGGIGQPGDWPNYPKKDSSYFDPILWSRGEKVQTKGYCSDVFADATMAFIEKNKNKPFFAYLAFNAPHNPLQLPEKYYEMYKNIDPAEGLNDDAMPMPEMDERQKEIARKVYGMVTNIDDNVKNVLEQLDRLGLTENTLVIFMTDNGPWGHRYRAGLKKNKGSVYQGGVQVPSFWRLPSRFKENIEVDVNAAHIDVLPTLAALCGVELPSDRIIDGKNLLPVIEGEIPSWKDRSLPMYWNRRFPNRYQNMAMVQGEWKLVGQNQGHAIDSEFELFDLSGDPYEQMNRLDEKAEMTVEMKKNLDAWYEEMITSPNLLNQPPAIINPEKENPTVLSRNDAAGVEGVWNESENVFGLWEVEFEKAGNYDIVYKFNEPIKAQRVLAKVQIGTVIHSVSLEAKGQTKVTIKNVFVPEIRGQLIPQLIVGDWPDLIRVLPFLVEIHPTEML